MNLSGLLSFVHIAVVSTQFISNQEESLGFIQNQYKSTGIHDAPTVRSHLRGSERRGRDEGINYDIQNAKINETRRHRNEMNIKSSLRTDQMPKIITNTNQDHYQGSNEHRSNFNSQDGKIIFKDKVNCSLDPLANHRKEEDNSARSTGPSTDPSVKPYTSKPISSITQRVKSLKSNTSIEHSSNSTVQGNSNNGKDESTTVAIDLDNRVAFTGDGCPTGQVKVEGKCVKEM